MRQRGAVTCGGQGKKHLPKAGERERKRVLASGSQVRRAVAFGRETAISVAGLEGNRELNRD